MLGGLDVRQDQLPDTVDRVTFAGGREVVGGSVVLDVLVVVTRQPGRAALEKRRATAGQGALASLGDGGPHRPGIASIHRA